MEEELNRGPEQLKAEVIKGGWCVSCGACVELCPYIKAAGDSVAVVHSCSIGEGNCYRVCPRTPTDYDYLNGQVTGSSAADPALGGYREIFRARAADSRHSGPGQYGGVVSALVAAALAEKRCDAALLTSTDGLYPRWTLARRESEVLAAAGSKYGVCPGLAGLNEALRSGNEKIAVVGRPCQVTALRKMQHHSTVEGSKGIGPIIGLFCFWGLDYSFYRNLRQEKGVSRIERADIPKDEGLTVKTDRGEIALTLEETRSFVRPGCHSCFDPTSELADISVGSTESDPAWCTVLARTAAGSELLEKASADGVIERAPCQDEANAALREAALNKKRRVLNGNDTGEGPAINNSYIRPAEELRRRLAGEGA